MKYNGYLIAIVQKTLTLLASINDSIVKLMVTVLKIVLCF